MTDTWGKWSDVATTKARASGRVEPTRPPPVRAAPRSSAPGPGLRHRHGRSSLEVPAQAAAARPSRRTTGRRGATAPLTRLPPGVLDRRRRRGAGGHRVGRPLGRVRLRRLHDEPPGRPHRSAHPGHHRGLPGRRAGAPGPTAAALRPRPPPGPPLHRVQRHARRPARDRAHPLLLGCGPALAAVARPARGSGPCPAGGRSPLIFVAMDGCNWFAHLANHRVRMLWRFHELHHSQEDMSVLTVFRTHPLIHVSYLIALIPGIVLLANGALPTTLLVIYGGIVAFAHSNTNLGFGPLGRIFVSPNFHRIHHQLDGPQDVNLGFALIDLGSALRPRGFPDARDHQDRHRVARTAARRRAGRRAAAPFCGLRRPTRGAVPARARGRRASLPVVGPGLRHPGRLPSKGARLSPPPPWAVHVERREPLHRMGRRRPDRRRRGRSTCRRHAVGR